MEKVTAREFPGVSNLLDMISSPDSIGINKLGDGATITTDTCNNVRKVRRLLVTAIDCCVNEQDWMQHLRNVWLMVRLKLCWSLWTDYLKTVLISKNLEQG